MRGKLSYVLLFHIWFEVNLFHRNTSDQTHQYLAMYNLTQFKSSHMSIYCLLSWHSFIVLFVAIFIINEIIANRYRKSPYCLKSFVF